jgi:hypothetical protein
VWELQHAPDRSQIFDALLKSVHRFQENTPYRNTQDGKMQRERATEAESLPPRFDRHGALQSSAGTPLRAEVPTHGLTGQQRLEN